MNVFSQPAYLLPPLVSLGASLLLCAIVWRRSPKSYALWIFWGMLLSVGLWSLLIFVFRTTRDMHQALLWNRTLPAVAIFTYALFYHFTIAYTQARGQKIPLFATYCLIVAAIVVSPTDLLMHSLRPESYGYAPNAGTLLPYFSAAGMLMMGGGVFNLLKRYRASSSAEERNRLLYVLMAVPFPVLGGLLDAFTNLPPATIWGNLAFCILCSVAILKYHLLDIRMVVRKGLAYLLVSLIVAIPYVSGLLLLSLLLRTRIELGWMHAFIILLLALALRPLYSWVQEKVDRAFYRDRYDSLRALEHLARETQSVVNLNALSSSLTQLVGQAVRSSSAHLLLASEDRKTFRAISSVGQDSPPSEMPLRADSTPVKWLAREGDILAWEDFHIVPQLQNLSPRERDALEKMGARLLVPIRTGQGQLSGIMVLGEKLSQQPYSDEDKRLLQTLSSQIAMAVENARLYSDALRAREDLEAWLNSMVDSVMISDTGCTVQFHNQAAHQKLGCTTGEKCWRALGKDDRCADCPVERYLGGNRDAFRRSDHIEATEYEITTAPLLHPDGSLSVITVLRDITERQEAERELRNSRQQLRNLAAHLQSVREEERKDIARELHDELGQALTALKFDLSWLGKQLTEKLEKYPGKKEEPLTTKVQAMENLMDKTVQKVRMVSAELRPGILDDFGLAAAIEWQADEFQRRTGVACQISLDGNMALDDATCTALFRIFQETLTNVARHAQAANVNVSLMEQGGAAVLEINDDGKGITEEQISSPGSLGLLGIRERAHALQGEVAFTGVQGRGTTVRATIPLSKGDASS